MPEHLVEQLRHLIDIALETEDIEEKNRILERMKTIVKEDN